MTAITAELIIRIHHRIMKSSEKEDDPPLADSIRDEGCLPAIEYGASHLTDPFDKAAYLLFSIATRHPFVEGNKRTAFTSAMVILKKETGMDISESPQNIYDFVKEVAVGSRNVEEIRKWFEDRIIHPAV